MAASCCHGLAPANRELSFVRSSRSRRSEAGPVDRRRCGAETPVQVRTGPRVGGAPGACARGRGWTPSAKGRVGGGSGVAQVSRRPQVLSPWALRRCPGTSSSHSGPSGGVLGPRALTVHPQEVSWDLELSRWALRRCPGTSSSHCASSGGVLGPRALTVHPQEVSWDLELSLCILGSSPSASREVSWDLELSLCTLRRCPGTSSSHCAPSGGVLGPRALPLGPQEVSWDLELSLWALGRCPGISSSPFGPSGGVLGPRALALGSQEDLELSLFTLRRCPRTSSSCPGTSSSHCSPSGGVLGPRALPVPLARCPRSL
ncbi:unnamed protein product [Nyctereutes procyonoides]|uniref:(raccoon dog) hypothetical protein n=1 Tax=Nyctereutes procyonoides TaxID=34880 RepID=A0A811YJ69_NYCPR|nr:unnamed protein product [Nyctereutes procyonoides]